MPDLLRCVGCGTRVLGYALYEEDPNPINRDDCHNCGGAEFELVTDE